MDIDWTFFDLVRDWSRVKDTELNPSPTPDGDHVDINEAARRLGLTPDAVRKRLRRGLLTGERVDGHWRVVVPESKPELDSVRDESDQRLIERLEDEIAFLRRELTDRTEELRRKDTILMTLAQRVPELPARATPAEEQTVNPSSTPEASDVARVVEETAPTPRPWWKVWRR